MKLLKATEVNKPKEVLNFSLSGHEEDLVYTIPVTLFPFSGFKLTWKIQKMLKSQGQGKERIWILGAQGTLQLKQSNIMQAIDQLLGAFYPYLFSQIFFMVIDQYKKCCSYFFVYLLLNLSSVWIQDVTINTNPCIFQTHESLSCKLVLRMSFEIGWFLCSWLLTIFIFIYPSLFCRYVRFWSLFDTSDPHAVYPIENGLMCMYSPDGSVLAAG